MNRLSLALMKPSSVGGRNKGIYRGPALAFSLCEVQRSQMDVFDAADGYFLGRADMGLPFLTALAPSELYCKEHRKSTRKITGLARQPILLLARCIKDKQLIITADSSYSALELLGAVKDKAVLITRPRLYAALQASVPKGRRDSRQKAAYRQTGCLR